MLRAVLSRAFPALSRRSLARSACPSIPHLRSLHDALPSSIEHAAESNSLPSATADQPITQARDSGRLLIGFTCGVCSTRTHRTMSRAAYTRGVVLVECPSCASRHLVADNLGWFGARKRPAHTGTLESGDGEYEPINVETLAQQSGQAVRRSVESPQELEAVHEALSRPPGL